MTEAAKGLHMKLYREYGAEYLGTDEYYERIDKTMRKRFPEAFPDESEPQKPQQKSKPSTVVASAKRSTAPKQVTLTATQAALAKKFKLTPEQYAREVLKLQGS
jgi:cytochrome c1